MSQKHLFYTLECPLNVNSVKNIAFKSKESIIDADVVLINPAAIHKVCLPFLHKYSDGTSSVPAESTPDLMGLFDWRKKQIEAVLKEGKIVFAFFASLSSCDCLIRDGAFVSTTQLDNYSWWPISLSRYIVQGYGDKLTLSNPQHWMASFYHAFKDILNYQAYLDLEQAPTRNVFITNKAKRTVGCEFIYHYRDKIGRLVLLPPFKNSPLAGKLIGVLLDCASKVLGEKVSTPPPDWISGYKLAGEDQPLKAIAKHREEIEKLNRETAKEQEEFNNTVQFKGLLYEQGKTLEDAVIESMRRLGFKAGNIKKDDLEHDIVFISAEGRGIAEVEGKNNKAVDIDKATQLIRVIAEDFSENDSYACGVLIGNPHRLKEPTEREKPFTSKVYISATRHNFSLLTTVELYRAIEYLFAHPQDDQFKQKCRETIFATQGKEIRFPVPSEA